MTSMTYMPKFSVGLSTAVPKEIHQEEEGSEEIAIIQFRIF